MPDLRHPLALPAALLGAALLLKAPALGLPLYNLDDWGGVRDGIALLEQGPGHARRLVSGELGPRGARPVPAGVWAAAWSLFGGWGGGYYAVDLLVHLVGAGALFALLRRLVGSTGAAAGTALWIFNGRLHQGAGYLGALDDDLAAAGTLLALALWPRARRGLPAAIGVALLSLLALGAKPTAFVIGPVLLALDVLERADLAPRALLRRYGPLGLAYGLYAVHLRGLLAFPGTGGGLHGGAIPGMAALVAEAVLAPLSGRVPGFEPRLLELLGWSVLASAALLGRRRVAWGALLVGLAWAAVAALPALVYLVSGDQGELEPRHAQPSALGLALVVAALARPEGRWGRAAVGAWVGMLALGYGLFETPVLLRSERTSAPALVQALRAHPDTELHVGLARLDHGVQGLMDLQGPARLVPGLRQPHLFLLGGERRTTEGPADAAPFRLGDGGPDGVLLVEQLPAPGEAPRTRFRAIDGPLPARHRGVAPRLRWSFPADGDGWAAGPLELLAPSAGLPPTPARAGFVLPSPRDPHRGAYGLLHAMTRPPYSAAHALRSPPLGLVPAAYCAVVLERSLRLAPDRRPPATPLDEALHPGGCGAAMLWTGGADFGEERSGIVHLQGCTGRGRERLVGRLDNSPAWRAAGSVQRLALLPARRAGEVTVHAVELQPCE